MNPAIENTATPSVSFTSTPTATDMIWNAVELTRSSLFGTAVGTFATATGLIGLLVRQTWSVLPILIVGVAFLTGLFIVPFAWWSIRQRRDLMLSPVQVSVDADGLSFTSAAGSARQAWSVFRNVRETPRAFILDTGANVAMLLSKKGVSDQDVAAFRSLARQGGAVHPPRRPAWLRTLVGVTIGLAMTALSVLAGGGLAILG